MAASRSQVIREINLGGGAVISVETWAEIRRLHLAERRSIKGIVREPGVAHRFDY